MEAADVADAASVSALAERLRKDRGLEIVRVFHAAGVMHYGPAASLDAEDLENVLAAKVRGARNLVASFEATQVVFFSSASSLLPSPLMAGYAAANAFLDAYADALRYSGVSACSVNWGTWGEVGMATRFEGRKEGAVLTGLRVLGTEEALDALSSATASGRAQVGAMRMDWPEWRRLYPDFVRHPFFQEVVGAVADDDLEAVDLTALPTLDEDGRRALLGDYLALRVGRTLGLAAQELDRARPINLMGFDSLMALETKNVIESDLGVVIPMVRLLEGPSVEEIVGELLARGAGSVERTGESAPAMVEGEI